MTLSTTTLALTTLCWLALPIQASAQTRISVGQQAPGFALDSSRGDQYDLSSLKGDKKLLLVFYRGTW